MAIHLILEVVPVPSISLLISKVVSVRLSTLIVELLPPSVAVIPKSEAPKLGSYASLDSPVEPKDPDADSMCVPPANTPSTY